jgi:hypothetical protein
MHVGHCVRYVAVGAAYGTSKAGIGIAGLGGFRPELIMRVCPYPERLSLSIDRLTYVSGTYSLVFSSLSFP